MKPCKHLDYGGDYTDCEVMTMAPHFPAVRFWRRGERWTAGGNPRDVQFCKLRGRVNDVFSCYNPGEMSCHEPVEGGGEPETSEGGA